MPAPRIIAFTSSSNMPLPPEGPEPRARATIELLVLVAVLLHQHVTNWFVSVAIRLASAEMTLQIPAVLVLWLFVGAVLLRRRRS